MYRFCSFLCYQVSRIATLTFLFLGMVTTSLMAQPCQVKTVRVAITGADLSEVNRMQLTIDGTTFTVYKRIGQSFFEAAPPFLKSNNEMSDFSLQSDSKYMYTFSDRLPVQDDCVLEVIFKAERFKKLVVEVVEGPSVFVGCSCKLMNARASTPAELKNAFPGNDLLSLKFEFPSKHQATFSISLAAIEASKDKIRHLSNRELKDSVYLQKIRGTKYAKSLKGNKFQMDRVTDDIYDNYVKVKEILLSLVDN